ncbi:MAG TPA: hypothetical protein VMB03_33720 [Bryobacteraceae bacterium]|nr:hypothetical protein [Bryobacteraceae bacterium]
MPGKKAHKPRIVPGVGTHGVQRGADPARKSTGQVEGQFSRDAKGRRGQYGGAGNAPLIKK